MIEGCPVQTDYIGPSTLVLSVAVAASTSGLQSSMKPGVYRDIERYVLVTAQTQFVLFGLLEGNVAVAAIRLNIGMTSYDLARHDERLQFTR